MIVLGCLCTVLLIALILSWRKLKRRKYRLCVCTHGNNVHRHGHGECMISNGISEKFPDGSNCACDIFIEKRRPKPSKDKSAEELERIVGL